jgi:ATP-dependent Clp protease ATP-binding subunit ClpA
VLVRLASILHSDHPDALLASRKFVSIPMAQYQDKMSAANLVGPPVGIEGTGQLTGALLEEPSAVVLLDEFEKAHPEAIPDVLLSALDGSGGFKDTKLNQYVPTNDGLFSQKSSALVGFI